MSARLHYIVNPLCLDGCVAAIEHATGKWVHNGEEHYMFTREGLQAAAEAMGDGFEFFYQQTDTEGILIAVCQECNEAVEEVVDPEPEPVCDCPDCNPAPPPEVPEEEEVPRTDDWVYISAATTDTTATITVEPETPPPPVANDRGDNVFYRDYWDGQTGPEKVKELVHEHLRPVLGDRKIVLTVPHGNTREVNTNPDEFHIKIWSAIEQ